MDDKKRTEIAKKITAGIALSMFITDLRRLQDAAGGDLELAMEAMAEKLGVKPEVHEITDMDAYLNERAVKAGLVAPCINPYCITDNGNPATVDRRKKKSGACCKACMNYECSHPVCVAKAKANGWKRYTHPWGTKIADEHKEYRVITK